MKKFSKNFAVRLRVKKGIAKLLVNKGVHRLRNGYEGFKRFLQLYQQVLPALPCTL